MNNSRLFQRYQGTALLCWQLNCLLLGANTCLPRLPTRFCQFSYGKLTHKSPSCLTQTTLCCDWKLQSWSQVSLSRVELPLVQVQPFSNASDLNGLLENTTAFLQEDHKLPEVTWGWVVVSCSQFLTLNFTVLSGQAAEEPYQWHCSDCFSWPLVFPPDFSAGNRNGKAHVSMETERNTCRDREPVTGGQGEEWMLY